MVRKYPHKQPAEVLLDLVATTPGDEGKWFAAAKDARVYDDALALASRSPCDPKTLARALRDFGKRQSAFAIEAGMLALHWLVKGYGCEITATDVFDAYRATLVAAQHLGTRDEVAVRMRTLVASEPRGGFVSKVLGRELGL